MNLDKLDRIVLTRKDAEHIMDWDKDNHYNYNREEFNFPLTEGIVELTEYVEMLGKELTTVTYFKITEEYLHFRQFDKSDNQEVMSFKIKSDESGGTFSDMTTTIKRATKDDLHKSARMTTYLCFCVFQYMTLVESNVVQHTESRSIRKKQKGKKLSKNNKNRIVKVTTTRYTFDHSKDSSRKYERHTLAWNVRGHWRQLKSGKRTWIPPYPKGNPDEVEPKEYKI